MKIISTLYVIAPTLLFLNFTREVQAQSLTTLQIDTNKFVILPIETARKAAIELEEYDQLKNEVFIINDIVGAQQDAIIFRDHEISLMHRKSDNQEGQILSYKAITTQMTMKAKKDKNEKTLLKGGIVVAFIVGVLIPRN